MSGDPLLAGKVAFSDQPLFTVYAEYFYSYRRRLAALREEDLPAGTVVGIVLGYEYPESIEHLRGRGVVFEPAKSEDINLKKLAAGRVDAAIINLDQSKTVDFIVHRSGVDGEVVPAFRTASFGSYIGFSRLHPKGEWARVRFNAGYAAITKSGELRQLKLRWGVH
jgi:polar amino acid transport system substrate-binding protein